MCVCVCVGVCVCASFNRYQESYVNENYYFYLEVTAALPTL